MTQANNSDHNYHKELQEEIVPICNNEPISIKHSVPPSSILAKPPVVVRDLLASCRICLGAASKNLLSIQNTCLDNIPVTSLLKKLLCITTDKDDRLPQNICKECITLLAQLYEWRKLCRNNEDILRAVLNVRAKPNQVFDQFTQTPDDQGVVNVPKSTPPGVTNTATQTNLNGQPTKNVGQGALNNVNVTQGTRKSNVKKLAKKKSCVHQEKESSVGKTDMTPKYGENNERSLPPNISQNCENSTGETKDKSPSVNIIGHIIIPSQTSTVEPLQQQPPEVMAEIENIITKHLKKRADRKLSKRKKIKSFICNICPSVTFNSSLAYRTHCKLLHRRPRVLCHICGQFIRRPNIGEHVKGHTKGRPFECSTCLRKFSFLGNLRRHERLHSTEQHIVRPYICEVCGKAVGSKAELQSHKRRVHGEEQEKDWKCDWCDKRFYTKHILRTHTYTHTGEKPYLCAICGQGFSQSSSLIVHRLIHSNTRNHKCTYCSKTFVQKNHLRTHLKTHTGERPYQCSFCGQRFALNGNLTVHVRLHTGEAPYVCDICGKGHRDSKMLRKHKLQHTSSSS